MRNDRVEVTYSTCLLSSMNRSSDLFLEGCLMKCLMEVVVALGWLANAFHALRCFFFVDNPMKHKILTLNTLFTLYIVLNILSQCMTVRK